MRRMIAALMAICVLLLGLPALAEEDAELALVRDAAMAELAEQTEAASGWARRILDKAEITDVARDEKSIHVTVQLPTLLSDVSKKDKAEDDPAAYLQKAMGAYLNGTPVTEVEMNATMVEKDGENTVKWGSGSPKSVAGKAKSLGNKARQSIVTNEVRQALDLYLVPETIDWPRSKPETVPEIISMADYAAQVAPALGLTADQAENRLRCLLALMDLTKFSASSGLEQATVTIRVKDWRTMLQEAYDQTVEAMANMVGIPEMSRAEIEQIYCDQMPFACMDSRYTSRGQVNEKLTVNVAAAIGEGIAAADGLMDYFRQYNEEFERHLTALMEAAGTMAYYPRVPLIDTAVLMGESVEGGVSVTFDMGNDAVNHGFVCVRQGGRTVLSGFVHNGVRLMVRLNPGNYQVYCSTGPEWFGEEYLFGRDGFFGRFDLTVEIGNRSVIHMEDVNGNLTVEEMTEEEFHQAIGQSSRKE